MKSKFRNSNFSSSDNVFIRLPSNSDMTWDRYVAPFSYGLWLAVAIAACVLSVCLALTNYGRERDQNLTVPAIMFYVLGCLCQQGETWILTSFLWLSRRFFAFICILLSSVPLIFFASFRETPIPISQFDIVYLFICPVTNLLIAVMYLSIFILED